MPVLAVSSFCQPDDRHHIPTQADSLPPLADTQDHNDIVMVRVLVNAVNAVMGVAKESAANWSTLSLEELGLYEDFHCPIGDLSGLITGLAVDGESVSALCRCY